MSNYLDKLENYSWVCNYNGISYYKINSSFTKREITKILKTFGLKFKGEYGE